MIQSSDRQPHCPICSGESQFHIPAPNWGEMRRCTSCGFVFASPLTQPEAPETLFERAYAGEETRSSMHQFHNRIRCREILTRAGIVETKWMYSSANREAFKFLQENFAQGSVVFDIGCGLGHFIEAVRRLGFEAYGLDISKDLVEFLQRRGFRVWHGTIDTLPRGWVEPEVCTMFGVIHHLPDPVSFLRSVRARFPKAMLLVAEGDYFHGIHPYLKRAVPPRTLGWWGPDQLKLAMGKAGYNAEVVRPKALSSDWGIEDFEFRVISTLGDRFPYLVRAYYGANELVFLPLALFYRLRGWSSYILGIGRPE